MNFDTFYFLFWKLDAEKKHDDIVGADGTGVVWDPSGMMYYIF